MSLTMITAVNDIPVHHDHRTEVTDTARAALIAAGWTPPAQPPTPTACPWCNQTPDWANHPTHHCKPNQEKETK